MKPSWDDAPEWATHLAMDRNGEWTWFEAAPVSNVAGWLPTYGRFQLAGLAGDDWQSTLEPRP